MRRPSGRGHPDDVGDATDGREQSHKIDRVWHEVTGTGRNAGLYFRASPACRNDDDRNRWVGPDFKMTWPGGYFIMITTITTEFAMPIKPVSEDLFRYVMKDIAGVRFEVFAKRVFAAVYSEQFVPLGGIHDGGADGVMSAYVQQVQGKATTFIQFSATDDSKAEGKIKDTIAALKKVGRNPQQLIYATSEALPKADLIVSETFERDSVLVQIRDYERLKGYVNSNVEVNEAFYRAFTSEISELATAAKLALPAVSEYANDPTVYVFLNHELRDRFSRDHLNNRVLDALIYWSLRETDPDKNIRLKRSEVSKKICDIFPAAKSVLLPNLDNRLQELSKKDAAGAERLRHYRGDDSFCLPFDMRRTLAAEAAEVGGRQARFREGLGARLVEEAKTRLTPAVSRDCVNLVFATVHLYFIEQGIVLAAFLEGHLEKVQFSDQIVEDTMVKALSQIDHRGRISPELFGVCMAVLRGIFYRTTAAEREYLAYLSRTSCLLVTMQSAPKLLEYLNKMGGNFRLLVGTDILVKALSEQYVENEFRQVTNMLLICKQLGAELVLTEPVLQEVFTHLHAADQEFRNHYAKQEPHLKAGQIAECDRILIRAYLHASRTGIGPKSWRAYVNNMTDPDGLHVKSGPARNALRGLLVQRFGMIYMSTEDLEHTIPAPKVAALAERLSNERGWAKHPELSKNDALMAYATYAQRSIHKEVGIYDGFGFRTWWLTKETRVLAMTGELVRDQGGVPYIMRPEFILNFVALAPKAADVRRSFSDFLPTTAGLQLGRYLDDSVMHSMLDHVGEWSELPPERVGVVLGEKINKLTHDRYKQYVHNISSIDQ